MTYTLNNNLKVFLKKKKGVPLKEWLEEHKEELKNHRIFYILRANLERGDVFKIGLSERGANSAYGRLNDYFHEYGEAQKKFPNPNPCMGVKLYLVVGNLFNPNVEASDSKVRRIETKMIAYLKKLGTSERGRERFRISIDKLFNALDDLGVLIGDEGAPAVKRSPRIQEHNQASKDTVKEIIGHRLDRRGKLTFETTFFDYIKFDSNQNAKLTKQEKQYLTYEQLVQLRDGKIKADAYIKKHNLK